MNDAISRLPRPLYRADQVRQLDRVAIEQFAIPGFQLMQTAGAVALQTLIEHWPQTRQLLVFAGGGNNGGDGYIVAGLAQKRGLEVELIQLQTEDGLGGDARLAWEWAGQCQVRMITLAEFQQRERQFRPHSVIVDALLGTGLDREVEGIYRDAIEAINSSGLPVLAIDVPSGLSADTGQPLGATVRATATLTFIGMKQGLLTGRGRDFVGRLAFSSLDIPAEVYSHSAAPAPAAERIDIQETAAHLRPRARASHKGSHGHVVVIGGDIGFGGAVLMAAEAALRSGAGLVSVISHGMHRAALLARCPEVMMLDPEESAQATTELLARAQVVAVGPGLGRSEWSRRALRLALQSQMIHHTPLIVDADGLRLLADSEDRRRENWILTPHPGEAAALLGCSVEEVQRDRFAAVAALAQRWGGCSLLKGSGSLLHCDDSTPPVFLCSEGNAGMATAGMGDVLSGVIAGLLAQGLSLGDSLRCAVCVHGEAADLAVAEVANADSWQLI